MKDDIPKKESKVCNCKKNSSDRGRRIAISIIIFLCILNVLSYIMIIPRSFSKVIIRRAIAYQLNKKYNELTPDNYEHVKELYLSDKKITNIKLLSELKNLEILTLYSLGTRNIYPTHLDRLLTKLGIRQFSSRRKINLRPLGTLTNIRILNLSGSLVSNLEPLKNLKNLQTLDLSMVSVSDYYSDPSKRLSKTQFLYSYEIRIPDLGPIGELKNLQILDLSNTEVFNLEPLKNLVNLRELRFEYTLVSDLEPLRRLTNLQKLDLSGTNVSDLEPLKELTNLRELGFNNTWITDLEPLKGLKNLERLWLFSTSVKNEQIEELQKALPIVKISH